MQQEELRKIIREILNESATKQLFESKKNENLEDLRKTFYKKYFEELARPKSEIVYEIVNKEFQQNPESKGVNRAGTVQYALSKDIMECKTLEEWENKIAGRGIKTGRNKGITLPDDLQKASDALNNAVKTTKKCYL